MIEITTVLALFVLLLISSATFFVSKRLRVPYTVLLVIVGLLLIPFTQIPLLEPAFGFMHDIVLTPELLFYVFLPILIFESAFNMSMRRMVENAWHISLLAIVGLLLSAAVIAGALYFIFGLIGLPIPLIVALLFAAIISSTDPVAVLALFKEYNAPKRLTLIFEGESLFNDGTAVALFLVILGIATSGFHGASTVVEGMGIFGMMLLFGIAFGLVMAILFSKALRFTKQNEFVSITVLIVSAHIVFILSDLINESHFLGVELFISPIIATTVAALFLGTYARHILSPRSDEYLGKSIEHLAFVANSLVFILAGSLFATSNVDFGKLWLPMLITIIVVALARAISVFAVVRPLNALQPSSSIPRSWETLLAWGSLRGALAIIVVLLIPESFTISGWQYGFTPRELLLALTIGCILATLFIKATTIGWLVIRLGVNKPTPFQEAMRLEKQLYYAITKLSRVRHQASKGFIPSAALAGLASSQEQSIEQLTTEREELQRKHSASLFIQSLHYTAIKIEKRYLKELYSNDEVNEKVYRRVYGKLNLQQEKIEYAQHENINPSLYIDRKDVFERFVYFTQNALSRNSGTSLAGQYQYYRAQSIISRKVLKTLRHMQTQHDQPVFVHDAYQRVTEIYEKHYADSSATLTALEQKHPSALAPVIADLTARSLEAAGYKVQRFYRQRGIADEAEIEQLFA